MTVFVGVVTTKRKTTDKQKPFYYKQYIKFINWEKMEKKTDVKKYSPRFGPQ